MRQQEIDTASPFDKLTAGPGPLPEGEGELRLTVLNTSLQQCNLLVVGV